MFSRFLKKLATNKHEQPRNFYSVYFVKFRVCSWLISLTALLCAGCASEVAPKFEKRYIEPPAQAKIPASTTALRVCADPNNLPFSNEKREGFENKIAALLGRELNLPVRYTWWAQRRGFFRNTLRAGLCDVVIGVPESFELAATTAPYYRSTYVFVSQRKRELNIKSLDDEQLKNLKIGVQIIGDDGANAPPAHALAARGITKRVVGSTAITARRIRRRASSTRSLTEKSTWRSSGDRSPDFSRKNRACRSPSSPSRRRSICRICHSFTTSRSASGAARTSSKARSKRY